MELEKQTYLNTEHLAELYERKERVFASYRRDFRYGGVRFVLRRGAVVRLTAHCEIPGGISSLYFDGYLLAKTQGNDFQTEIRAEKGEHLFEMVAPLTNDGFWLSAESVGLEKGRQYADRMGGYSDATKNYLFIRHGDRYFERAVISSSTISLSSLNGILYDGALLYDKSTESYTSDVATVSASGSTSLTVDTGVSESIAVSGLKYAAICDGFTLPNGVDYLVAYVGNGGLRVAPAQADQAFSASDFSDPMSEIVRVTSAQRGSVLLTQNTEGLWKGMYFHSSGDHSLVCGSLTIPYYEVSLTRNRIVAPNAHIEGTNQHPAFYYRTEKGELMRLLYGAAPTRKGYMQAYCSGYAQGTGVAMQDGEVHTST